MTRSTISFIVSAIVALAFHGCGPNGGVEKTRDGLVVDIAPEAPAQKVRLTVYDERILGVSTFSGESDPATPVFFPGAEGLDTPFHTQVDENSARVYTSFAGVKVDRQSAELTFTDSVGAILLTLIPGEIAAGSLETALIDQIGGFKILFAQTDSLVPDTLSAPVDTVGSVPPLRVSTDGYNVLWRGNDDGVHEEFFLIFGEAINSVVSSSQINP